MDGSSYRRLPHVFHTTGIHLEKVTGAWVRVVLNRLRPIEIGGRRALVADGLKVPKGGRRMPGVTSLHQESQNNGKPECIMGHSFQAVGMLVETTSGPACVPLARRLHEGVRTSPRDSRTLLAKLDMLVVSLASLLGRPTIRLADAYYASSKVIPPPTARGHHLVTRVRTTCVAHEPVPTPRKRKRGRPRIYGTNVRLNDSWARPGFVGAPSPVHGETGVTIRHLVLDLVRRPVTRPVRVVLAEHPTRGRPMLLTTDLQLEPLQVIRPSGLRFKIEVAFKQAIHTIGAYGHHFWMKGMRRTRRGGGDQYPHRASPTYRRDVQRELRAYDLHAQLGCIAQGTLQVLAVNHRKSVRSNFHSWMRTMRPDATPSEAIAAQSLRPGNRPFSNYVCSLWMPNGFMSC